MNKVRHYYVSGHTRNGFFSVLPELSKDLDCIFVLKGLSISQTNHELLRLGGLCEEQGFHVDYLHSPSNNDLIEGLRFPAYKVAVVSNDLVSKLGRTFTEQRVVVIHFTKAYDKDNLQRVIQHMKQLEKERDYHIQSAYETFADAKHFHERKEEIYLSAMSFPKADEVTDDLITSLFPSPPNDQSTGKEETIFFGAATPKGAVHFIDELTVGLNKRYIIKGRSGCGKSTLMKRVANQAKKRGMSVTYFLCGFDPNSYDMIIIEELQIAILDGTAPHVIDPTRETDEVIDMFELCVNPQIEVERMTEIKECESEYKERMKKGTMHLRKAAEVQDVIDSYHDSAIDQEQLATLEQQMVTLIMSSLD
ncbi:hypothetical protein [Bacillus alkalicellulosilyticus]|uniref:hypothetical protein n=1 Tax=Alkalihalobacterium alkalicellulosilyticum TaxID=1912214 RepID=UPI0009968163|nr:hypothetical protein [Bacillus alkalicellulosilyticus]